MADETQISTPTETTGSDTSTIVEPDFSETSTVETETIDPAAETETDNKEQLILDTLYAGKYKTVEELEKGYNEAQKFINKASEFEKKYNELLEKQTTESVLKEQRQLEEARQQGFRTVEEQQISQQVQLAEFEYFANNIQNIAPEYLENAQNSLIQYYNTGNRAFLDDAKRYFPSEIIENIALAKAQMQNRLYEEFATRQNEKFNQETAKLAEVIKSDFAEFLEDIPLNEGKAQALKSFCDVGSINSKEDMQIFQDIYSQIAKYEREQAIKEYEAAKAIENTKNKAMINGNDSILTSNTTLTSADISKMSQKEFDEYCDKHGMDWIWNK